LASRGAEIVLAVGKANGLTRIGSGRRFPGAPRRLEIPGLLKGMPDSVATGRSASPSPRVGSTSYSTRPAEISDVVSRARRSGWRSAFHGASPHRADQKGQNAEVVFISVSPPCVIRRESPDVGQPSGRCRRAGGVSLVTIVSSTARVLAERKPSQCTILVRNPSCDPNAPR